ncbi:mechanosensitive ion channel family protein, partial [Chamaesiphon polymorphus]|uniref:mechanosensitive ion channel family protein n=1 Tax=Chamaesiphon polymorphus TaxID=2107691 RepID=UPI001FEBC5D3
MDNKTELLVKIQIWIADFGIKAISAFMLVLIGIQLARFLQTVVGKSLQKARIDATLGSFASNLVYIAVVAMTVIVAMGQLGVQTASFIAILGSIGVAIGLALQGSLSNFAAGILIIVLRPFKVGDYIECLNIGGTVTRIHPLNTTLITPDNRTIVAPNRKLFDDCLTNHSAQPQRRIDLVFGTGYENDIDRVKQITYGSLIFREGHQIVAQGKYKSQLESS